MLNEALRLTRVFHGINQAILADKLGISRSYLSELESGKKAPSLDILDKYSSVFDIPPSALMLFSESLDNNSFAEKSRVIIAKKILKIMDWLSETEDMRNDSKNITS